MSHWDDPYFVEVREGNGDETLIPMHNIAVIEERANGYTLITTGNRTYALDAISFISTKEAALVWGTRVDEYVRRARATPPTP